MNTSGIVNNTFVKNYKELCLLIKEKERKGGDSKKAHMKEIERFIKLERKGNGFWIREKYKIPLEKINGNETGYIINIEKLILDLLAQEVNNGNLFLSKNRLLHELNMINSNYSFCYSRMNKLSAFMDIEESNIEEFYSSSNSMMKRNIESVLTKLRKRALIYWNTAITICIINTRSDLNEFDKTKVIEISKGFNEYGEEVFEYVPCIDVTDKEYRKATKEEVELILASEHEVLDELNCKSMQEVIIRKLWNSFNRKVIEILKNKANILFYYDSYEIIYNQDNIITAIKRDNDKLNPSDRIKNQKMLNDGIVEKVNINAKNRHNNAIKYLDNDVDIKDYREEILIRRSEDSYINNNEKLVKTLIKSNGKDIRKSVRGINIK